METEKIIAKLMMEAVPEGENELEAAEILIYRVFKRAILKANAMIDNSDELELLIFLKKMKTVFSEKLFKEYLTKENKK